MSNPSKKGDGQGDRPVKVTVAGMGLSTVRKTQDPIRAAMKDAFADSLSDLGSSVPSVGTIVEDAYRNDLNRALSEAANSIRDLATEAQSDILASLKRQTSISFNEFARGLHAIPGPPSISEQVAESHLEAMTDISVQLAEAMNKAIWLTPEQEVASFEERVRERLNMSAADFIRELDAGRWDDVIDDPDHRDVLDLALMSDVVRGSVG